VDARPKPRAGFLSLHRLKALPVVEPHLHTGETYRKPCPTSSNDVRTSYLGYGLRLDKRRPLRHKVIMNKLDAARRARIVSALCEGTSVRATCRMTDSAKGTVLRLLADVGAASAEYQDEV